jgi:hypothetical protein
MHLTWDDDNLRYVANRAGFNDIIRRVAQSQGASHSKKVLSDCKRQVRLEVCGCLAGPIAESLYENREFDAWDEDGWEDPGADMARADGLARLLPHRGELEHACAVTSEALRAPETWARVIALADELERMGTMDSDAVVGLLPQPLPDWPPSSAEKEQAP